MIMFIQITCINESVCYMTLAYLVYLWPQLNYW